MSKYPLDDNVLQEEYEALLIKASYQIGTKGICR